MKMVRRVTTDSDSVAYLDVEEKVRETEKAVLFKTTDHGEVWIPKSMIEDEGDDLVGVKKWWAGKEGLI